MDKVTCEWLHLVGNHSVLVVTHNSTIFCFCSFGDGSIVTTKGRGIPSFVPSIEYRVQRHPHNDTPFLLRGREISVSMTRGIKSARGLFGA